MKTPLNTKHGLFVELMSTLCYLWKIIHTFRLVKKLVSSMQSYQEVKMFKQLNTIYFGPI